MVTIAHRNCGKHCKVSLLTADIENLPFKDECFEGVSCCFVINLLSGFHEALPEMRRVLAKGGKFIVADVETSEEQRTVRNYLLPVHPRIKGMRKPIDFSQMGEILEKFDFSVNNAKKYQFSLRDAKLYVIEASKL